jgi:endonuclease YncB( thermonuclease family)
VQGTGTPHRLSKADRARITEAIRQRHLAQQETLAVTVSDAFSGKCIGVSHGDTFTVLYNNQPVKVRLYGVDAPESRQPFGTKAKQFTSELALGQQVTIYVKGVDRYRRVLGWVFVGKTSVNTELVRSGYAWWYRQYSPRETKLGLLQDQAKQARHSLWSDARAQAPWEFRRVRR